MNPEPSQTTSNAAGLGHASNTAADPQNGSMYCAGDPRRNHTSAATMRLPPKYGNGDSKGAIDLGVLPGFAELFGSFLFIALFAQTDDIRNPSPSEPIHTCVVRA
jgi:hypothetical protein